MSVEPLASAAIVRAASAEVKKFTQPEADSSSSDIQEVTKSEEEKREGDLAVA